VIPPGRDQHTSQTLQDWIATGPRVELLIGVPKDILQKNIDLARSTFTIMGLNTWITFCDVILAKLYLRENNLLVANLLFQKCLRSGLNSEDKSSCLEWLGNASQWGVGYSMSG
jgi:hypothetical protein